MSHRVIDDIVEATMYDKGPSFFVNFPVDKILPQMCQRQQFDDAYSLGTQMEKAFGPGSPHASQTPTPGYINGF